MIETSIALLAGLSVAGFVLAHIAARITGLFTDSRLLSFLGGCIPAVLLGVFVATGTYATIIVATVPLWGAVILGLLGVLARMTIFEPLGVRGYLGNQRKWHYELAGDEEFHKALAILDPEEVAEIAHTSADAEDYRENLIDAAKDSDPFDLEEAAE